MSLYVTPPIYHEHVDSHPLHRPSSFNKASGGSPKCAEGPVVPRPTTRRPLHEVGGAVRWRAGSVDALFGAPRCPQRTEIAGARNESAPSSGVFISTFRHEPTSNSDLLFHAVECWSHYWVYIDIHTCSLIHACPMIICDYLWFTVNLSNRIINIGCNHTVINKWSILYDNVITDKLSE